MDDGINHWPSETLSDAGAEAFYKAALERRESAEKDTIAIRRQSVIIAAGSLVVTVLALASALVVYIKTPVPKPPDFILVHDTTGVVDQPTSVKNAPRLFGESVRVREIREFIKACESYIPQTWAKIDFHDCMIRATHDEQKRREKEIGKGGPRYPVTIFGTTGYAMPSAFPDVLLIGVIGTEPNQTFRYMVRYERTEVLNNVESRVRWTADVAFAFHPELKIGTADAQINNTGFQASMFSTIKDRIQ